VLSDDCLCLESNQKGFFRYSGGIERISYFTGEGNAVLSGGYTCNS